MPAADASVVVPTCDEGPRLERTLDSLAAQLFDGRLEAIDGFDDGLGFLEDTDLSLRLSREGSIVYDHTCPVETSARWQNWVGYARLFWTYLVGYLEYALPGASPARDYF